MYMKTQANGKMSMANMPAFFTFSGDLYLVWCPRNNWTLVSTERRTLPAAGKPGAPLP